MRITGDGQVRFRIHRPAAFRLEPRFGERGCGVWADGAYAEAEGVRVTVADSVGAGDAFAAALVHGLSLGWAPSDIGAFANRVGELVASRPGGTPEWSLDEIERFRN